MAKMNKAKNTMIDGVGASEALDSTGERLMMDGLDITSLQEGTGVFNYEHKNDTPAQIVGKVLYAKKIFKPEDCENERQSYFWDKVQCPYLYVKGELFDGENSDSAKEVAAALRYDAKQRAENPKGKDVYGFSIEGSKLEKNGQEITHSIARKVTVTQAPANKSCFAEICPEEGSEDDSLDFDFMKSEKPLKKTLTASQGNVAPSSLSGFQALVPENMDKTIKDSNFGKLFSQIHAFVKKKYPAKKPQEVEAIAKVLVDRTIRKAEESLMGLRKFDQPIEAEGDDPSEPVAMEDAHSHLMDNKNFAIQLEDALHAHEQNRLMGETDPFYKLLADSDERLVTHMNDLGNNDMSKALPEESAPKIITPKTNTKKEFWQHQANKRAQNMKDFMENDLPKFKELATNKKTGEISKANAHALRMRTKYRQKMLDTAKLAANADDLPEAPPIHVGFSNEKLRKDGIATFDIQPDASCPGAHGRGCLGNCYFMKGQSFNLPDNEEKILHNTASTARKDFADRMIQHLGDLKQRENIKHLRIHSGGDMYHQDYADDWAKIAKAHPDINFYIYTKSHHLNFDKHNQLPNFTVNHSQGSIYDHLLPEDAPKVEIAPNKKAFDYLVSQGFKDATTSDKAAAENKEKAPLVLMYHTGSKDAYNPKHMLSSRARSLLADKFGEEEGFKVERKEESKPKAPPKPKKKLSREQIEKRMAKLKAQLESMEMSEKPFHGYNKKKHAKTGGLNDSYRKKYNRETGSHLKRPVTGKVKAGSEAAGRRKSFCARMSGVKGPTSKEGKLTPKGAALKRWKCGSMGKAEDQSKKVIPPRPEGKPNPANKPKMTQKQWYNMSYKDKKAHVERQLRAEREAKLIAEGKMKSPEQKKQEFEAWAKDWAQQIKASKNK